MRRFIKLEINGLKKDASVYDIDISDSKTHLAKADIGHRTLNHLLSNGKINQRDYVEFYSRPLKIICLLCIALIEISSIEKHDSERFTSSASAVETGR